MFERRITRSVDVGGVQVGAGSPITVQSMTTTKTADVDATLEQIYSLATAGAEIVRCTCNDFDAAEGLARIVPRHRYLSLLIFIFNTDWHWRL